MGRDEGSRENDRVTHARRRGRARPGQRCPSAGTVPVPEGARRDTTSGGLTVRSITSTPPVTFLSSYRPSGDTRELTGGASGIGSSTCLPASQSQIELGREVSRHWITRRFPSFV